MVKKKRSKLAEWQAKAREGGVCTGCGKHREVLTVDHIIPVYIVDMFDVTGEAKFEDEQNFQLLCYPCNRFKGNNIDVKHINSIDLLSKYMLEVQRINTEENEIRLRSNN